MVARVRQDDGPVLVVVDGGDQMVIAYTHKHKVPESWRSTDWQTCSHAPTLVSEYDVFPVSACLPAPDCFHFRRNSSTSQLSEKPRAKPSMSQEPNGNNGSAPDIDMHAATPAVLPQLSEFDSLLADLKKDGNQPEKWRALVDMAEKSGHTEQIQQAYESLLARYPNTVRHLTGG